MDPTLELSHLPFPCWNIETSSSASEDLSTPPSTIKKLWLLLLFTFSEEHYQCIQKFTWGPHDITNQESSIPLCEMLLTDYRISHMVDAVVKATAMFLDGFKDVGLGFLTFV